MKNTATTYKLYASNGRYIRQATLVTLADGRIVRFLDRLPKGEAIRRAMEAK